MKGVNFKIFIHILQETHLYYNHIRFDSQDESKNYDDKVDKKI